MTDDPEPHRCGCGERFRTLSKMRLHQRDKCPLRVVDEHVEDWSIDEIAEKATDELYTCGVCGADIETASGVEYDTTAEAVTIVLFATCEACGAFNENKVFI